MGVAAIHRVRRTRHPSAVLCDAQGRVLGVVLVGGRLVHGTSGTDATQSGNATFSRWVAPCVQQQHRICTVQSALQLNRANDPRGLTIMVDFGIILWPCVDRPGAASSSFLVTTRMVAGCECRRVTRCEGGRKSRGCSMAYNRVSRLPVKVTAENASLGARGRTPALMGARMRDYLDKRAAAQMPVLCVALQPRRVFRDRRLLFHMP